MVKKTNIVIHNMTMKEFSDSMAKINTNYKNFKKEWCISVKQEGNVFDIFASSKVRFIASSRGNFEEFMKIMKIKLTEEDNHLLLEKSYKFKPSQFILIILIPYLSYFLLLAIGLYILLSFLLSKSINFWFFYTEFLLAILALSNFVWTRDSKKLEIARYQIIEEILQRHLYDS